ncbi:hypothetical protein ACA910_017364 [Epithemia clementina (nom. ined.)]
MDDVLEDLKQMVALEELVQYKNAISVMVSNFGKSEMVLNFVCNANSRGLDTYFVLVIATVKKMLDSANSIGLAAYYNKKMFSHIPTKSADSYGNPTFPALMTTKFTSIHLNSQLGYYNFFKMPIFVWFQHPLEDYFTQANLWSCCKDDVIAQEDGACSIKYAPHDVNSGFYFLQNNPQTRVLMDECHVMSHPHSIEDKEPSTSIGHYS